MELLDQVHVFVCGVPAKFLRDLVEPDRVDDEPSPSQCTRVAIEGRLQVFWVTLTVEEQLTVHVRVAFEKDDYLFRRGPERRVIRRHAGRSAGKAARFEVFGTLLRRAVGDDLRCPRQNFRRASAEADAGPDAGEIGMAVGKTRQRPRGSTRGAASAARRSLRVEGRDRDHRGRADAQQRQCFH